MMCYKKKAKKCMKSAAYTQPLTTAMDEPPSPAARPYDAPALVKNRSTSSDSASHHSWGYGLRRWLRHLCGQKDTSLKEAVEEAIEEHEEQSEEPLAPEERVMLHNVLDISDTTVN